MSDNNYNDIIPSNGDYQPEDYGASRHGSASSKLIKILIVILLLVLVSLIALIFFRYSGMKLPFSSGREQKTEQTAQQSTVVSATTPIPSESASPAASASRSESEIQAVKIPESTDETSEVLLRYHILAAGETVESVAEQYGLDARTVRSVNRNTDMPGVLRIPTRDGMMYTVKEGDSLIKIISKYRLNITASQLAQVNGISETDPLPVGGELFIPLI